MHLPKNRLFLLPFIFMAALLFPLSLEAQQPYYSFPTNLTLCGEPVPLHDRKFWEMMDREFTLAVYDRAQVFLLLTPDKSPRERRRIALKAGAAVFVILSISTVSWYS